MFVSDATLKVMLLQYVELRWQLGRSPSKPSNQPGNQEGSPRVSLGGQSSPTSGFQRQQRVELGFGPIASLTPTI